MKQLLLLFVLSLLFLFSSAQPGTLDPTFGSSGKVTTHINQNDAGTAMAVQPNGKIVVGGYTEALIEDFALVRYNPDGSLDNSFGSSGKVTTDFYSGFDRIWDIALQSDGKILAAGQSYFAATLEFNLVLARYNADGTLDLTFGTLGKVTTYINGYDWANAIALQPDGKIIVAGATKGDFALIRYNTDGSLDNSFGSSGKVITDFALGNDNILSIAIQPDGKIVAGGYSHPDFALARYNPDGSLDNTFDGDGKVITDIRPLSSSDLIYSITLQSNGKIIAAGSSYVSGQTNADFVLTRYNTDGSLDNGFGINGKVITDLNGSDDIIFKIALQADGKIVTAGSTGVSESEDFALARYTSSGALDNSFDGDGKAILNFGRNDRCLAVTLFGSRIYTAGFTNVNGTYDFALAAFQNDANIILPVSLTSFTASKQNASVQLNWKVANEQTISSFEVERSADNRSFTKIGTVNAANTSEYAYTDYQPQTAINYYRLKIVNRNGAAAYGQTVVVRLGAVQKFEVFPNPAVNVINLQTTQTGNLLVQIQDITGRTVKTLEVKNSAGTLTTSLDISGLQKGVYMIKIADEVLRFMKQ